MPTSVEDQEYGAAQPIVDVAKKFYRSMTSLGKATEKKPEPDDTHERLVREANESFAKKQPDAKPAPKPPAKTPSYKTGIDKVPKTGLAKLHKGEAVLNKEDAEEYREKKGSSMSRAKSVMGGGGKKKSKRPHSMHIRRGKSGGFIAQHHFAPNEQGQSDPMEEHVLPDTDALAQHVQDQMGGPAAPPPPVPAPTGM